ncbi:MAG: hypothetical protein EPO11_00995 [Gammaproteobacteria bacterium]|nr:MAG: hypothetical protein EPO11_00995 [Gammaproteobacteria bacterium]
MTDQPTPKFVQTSWRSYLITIIESLSAFFIASFALTMYYFHRGEGWIPMGLVLLALYLFVIIACIKRLIEKLSMAALMLFAPIGPLAMLILSLAVFMVAGKFK